MRESLKIAAVFIGTIVGAGLASGQEILQFFGLYGIKGFLGILLTCLLYIMFSVIIISLCFKFKFRSYEDIVIYVLGKKLGRLTDIFLTFFIFAGNTIMISGGGAMLHEYAGIDRAWGIFIMSALVLVVTAFSTKGLVAVNALIVPLSTLAVVILGLAVFTKGFTFNEISMNLSSVVPVKKNWVLSGILYAAFNLMAATGVLCPMVAEMKNKRNFIRGCIIGSVTLTILALLINFSTLFYYPKSFQAEIPNLHAARQYGMLLPLFLTIIIWLEMFSTEVGNLYSLGKRMNASFKIPYITSLLIIVLVSIPVSFIGFSNLIRLLYPPFGAVSLVFLVGCLVKYVKHFRGRKFSS
jgi:uncharacterized membrane protein YkvI